MDITEFIEGKVDWKGRTARRDKHGGPWASSFILGTFGFENLAVVSLQVNLVSYFTRTMHINIADAANTLTTWMGTTYLLTLIVAFLADTYVGRFRSVLVSATIEFLGLGLLALQAHYDSLKPPLCNIFDPQSQCTKVNGSDAAMLFVGLYLVAFGSGGIRAALPSHGADQFDDKDPKEVKQQSSFFNWLLLALCLGGAVSLVLFVWIEDYKGWGWGFTACTVAMFFAVLVFALALPKYRIHVTKGSSALVEIAQVFVAAIRKRNLELPENPHDLYEIDENDERERNVEFLEHTDAFRFLDKAAIRPPPSQAATTQHHQYSEPQQSPWIFCRVTQVENTKILLNMVPVFCCTFIMTLCLAQLQTFSVQQGVTMDTRIAGHVRLLPASLPIIPVAFLIVLIPIYDKIIVPFARKLTGVPTGITYLQRVGVGLILSSISMAIAALVEVKRKNVARDHHMLLAIPLLDPPLPISVFWLSIQYFVFGIADMFTYVGLLEFFYSQVPKDLKSISSCFLWTSMAVGYYMSTITVNVVNRVTKGVTRSGGWLNGNNINLGHLNLFYWLLSVMSLLNFFVYLFVSRRYKYRQEKVVRGVSVDQGSRVHDVQTMET